MQYRTRIAAAALCAVTATAALAHSGVTNKAVKAWMQTMSAIGQNTKVLGTMSKGVAEFDALEARRAAKAIAQKAGQIPELFKTPASDPKSEALPVIWQDFEDFSAKATDLRQSALRAAATIRTRSDLRAAMTEIGGACQACHKAYRE